MPAVKRFSVSFAKHPTNGTSASLQVYFHFFFFSTSLCFACQWKPLFISEIYVGFVFFHVISAIFLNTQPASYPFHILHYLSLSETSCGQLSLSPSDSMLISLRLTVCVDEFKHVFVFPVLVCAQVCGAVSVVRCKKISCSYISIFFLVLHLGSKIT